MREIDEYEDDVIDLGREVLAGESATGYGRMDAVLELRKRYEPILNLYADIAACGDCEPYNELLLRSACDLVESYYRENDV